METMSKIKYEANWPRFITQNDLEVGFSNRKLTKLVSFRRGHLEGFPRLAPFASWQTAVYSLGRCYRDWLRWPWYLPLPMDGDHGIQLQRDYFLDANSSARTYFTWSSWRATYPDLDKKIYWIRHPWVTFRQKRGITPRPDSKGTLVFISHTVEDSERVGFDFSKYLSQIKALPEKFQPITLCIQMHDVHKGLHASLRDFGFPIVSAGNTASPYFVDRFYDLVTRFKYCSSNMVGSQLFFCEEAGVPYFLLGEETLASYRGGPVHSYYQGADAGLLNEVIDAFGLEKLNETQKEVKRKIIVDALGLERGSEDLRSQLRARMDQDFRLLWRSLYKQSFTNIVIGIWSLLKQIGTEINLRLTR